MDTDNGCINNCTHAHVHTEVTTGAVSVIVYKPQSLSFQGQSVTACLPALLYRVVYHEVHSAI